ncbi:hypothetical protein HOY80DRAFT_256550 [Tuber brumale]|nr:hypothetical protein HOY80DRAFT_256550 [Tuber brumale]
MKNLEFFPLVLFFYLGLVFVFLQCFYRLHVWEKQALERHQPESADQPSPLVNRFKIFATCSILLIISSPFLGGYSLLRLTMCFIFLFFLFSIRNSFILVKYLTRNSGT